MTEPMPEENPDDKRRSGEMPPDEPSESNRGDADPFSHLHKMSTTAGLGSGDYVAINGTAIAAILLGVGSALVLFNNLVFLVIPLLGIAAAILAFKQIIQSNGTQTGREVAAIGLLLSVGFGGFYVAKTGYNAVHNRADREQIVSNVRKLGELVKAHSYPEAYALFDDRFRKRVPLAKFTNSWQQMSASPLLGGVQSLDWNQLLSFDMDPVDGTQLANGMMLLKCRPTEPLRLNMSFRREDGNWLVDQMPQMFPTDAAPDSSGAGAKGKGSTFIGPPKP
jgi:hypothetical protein